MPCQGAPVNFSFAKVKKIIVWLVLFIATIGFVFLFPSDKRFLIGSLFFMIGIHELGHLGMAKWLGLKTGGFYFLPGLGGVALLKEFPKERWGDFLVYWAGPAVGFLETLILFLANLYLQIPILWTCVFFWALINLINLLPVLPLDGGGIARAWCSNNSENYLRSFSFYIFTTCSMLVLITVAGVIFPLIILFFGIQQRKYLLAKQNLPSYVKIQMSAGQIIKAAFLTGALISGLALLCLAALYHYVI